MKRFLWILAGLAVVVVGALAYLVIYFHDEMVAQRNYTKTYVARESRRLRKQEGNDNEPDHLDVVVEQLTEVLKTKSQDSNEENN